MKKYIIYTAALFIAAASLSACSKKSSTTTPTTGGTVTTGAHTMNQFGGQDSVTVDFFGQTGNIMGCEAVSTDSSYSAYIFLVFHGNAKPAAGNYQISVDNTIAGSVSLAEFYYTPTGEGLYFSETSTAMATVTNTAGKLSVTIPSITVSGLFTPSASGSSSYSDSTTFSGTLKEF